MDYSHIAIALLLLSVTIIFAEIFIPSGGILGMVAVTTVLAALVCAWNAWWVTSPNTFWIFLGTTFLAVPSAAASALYVFPNTPMGKIALLEPPKLEDLTADDAHDQHLRAMIGKTGVTVGLLTPGGVVMVNGERQHCESEGMLIESGVEVDVIALKAARLVVRVRPVDPADSADFGDRTSTDTPDGVATSERPQPDPTPTTDEALEAEPPLDFPISQG